MSAAVASDVLTLSTTTDPPAPRTVADAAATIMGPLTGTATVWALDLGLRLGVFDALAAAPDGLTAAETAQRLGLDPVYTHAVLRSAYAAEVCEAADGRYRLAEHMGSLLLDSDHPAFLGGAVRVLVGLRETFVDLRTLARTGGREWWDDFDPEWIEAVGMHCQTYYRRILDTVVPAVPGLSATLEAGARYLDLACGTCRGPAKVLARYPGTRVTAVDADAYTLEVAEAFVTGQGMADRFTFRRSFLEELDLAGGHDVAVINVSLHEARDMAAVVARTRAALEPGGLFLVSEFPFPEDEAGCRTPAGRLMCGVQFFEAHIGCRLQPTRTFVDLLTDAGFTDVGVVPVTPTHVVVHGRA